MANIGRNCSPLKLFHFERGLGNRGQVQQHLWEEGVHGARHLQDAGYQSHNTDLKPAMIVWLDIPDKVTTNLITLIVKTIFNNLLAEAYNLVTHRPQAAVITAKSTSPRKSKQSHGKLSLKNRLVRKSL